MRDRDIRGNSDIDKMKKNAVGTATLYVGPQAPEGFEANWIPSGASDRCQPSVSTV